MSSHTHNTIVIKMGLDPRDGGMIVVDFAPATPRSKKYRRVYGFVDASGLSLYDHDDERACDLGAARAGSQAINLLAAATASATGVTPRTQCPYREVAHLRAVEGLRAAGESNLESALVARPVVNMLTGRPAAEPEPRDMPWVWDDDRGWRENASRTMLCITNPEWPVSRDDLGELAAWIPEKDPFYQPNEDVLQELIWAMLFLDHNGRGKNVMLEGPAGSGKDTLVEYAAAILGAPLAEITVGEGTTASHLVVTDVVEATPDGSRTRSVLGIVAECLQKPMIINIGEGNRMPEGQNAPLLGLLQARPGRVLPLRGSQSTVPFSRHAHAVATITQNREASGKHDGLYSQGAALRSRCWPIGMEMTPTQMIKAARSRLDAMLADATFPTGVDGDLYAERAKAAMTDHLEAFVKRAMADERATVVNRVDLSPAVVAKTAFAAGYLPYERAFRSGIAGVASDINDTIAIVDWAAQEFAGPYLNIKVQASDI